MSGKIEEKYQDLSKLVVNPTKLLCLLKVTQQSYAESLADGMIFCRHMQYYKDAKFENEPFFDPHEGLSGVFQPDRINMQMTDPKTGQQITIKGEEMAGPIILSGNLAQPTFCLHAMHTGEWTDRKFTENEMPLFKSYLQIPDEMGKFKDYVWVISNGEEFFKRLEKACLANNIQCRFGFVQYVDLDVVHGKVSESMVGFVKQKKHASEREYRLVFSSNQPLSDPFVLQLGSLRDISTVMSLGKFMTDWSISFPEEETVSEL